MRTCTIISATKMGQMQYPNIEMDWKYEILPPNILMLKVTMMPPANTAKINAINVVVSNFKQGVLSIKNAKMRHIKNGPHKSQFLT